MNSDAIWVVIPAAGVGKRMQSSTPKQYMPLVNDTVISYTLNCFRYRQDIQRIIVGISKKDDYWVTIQQTIKQSDTPNSVEIITSTGGNERCDTVLNSLALLLEQGAHTNDWVLVHDAARPCLQQNDIDTLIQTVTQSNACGGLLAYPVRDTMKRQITDIPIVTQKTIDFTEERSGLWHALTPQMFRLGELYQALNKSLCDRIDITDESSAIEYLGQHPLLVEGSTSNIKITRPEDLNIATFILQQRD